MANIGDTCKYACCCVSFLWTAVLVIMAVAYLESIRPDFVDILESIPDPQIRIVKHPDFLGPMYIICSPSIINLEAMDNSSSSLTTACDEVFDEFDQVTTTQMYFSWLYLDPPPDRDDPDSPINSTTIKEMKDGRYSLFILFAISLFLDLLMNKCVQKAMTIKYSEHIDKGCSEKVAASMFAMLNAAFGINVSHMLMCTLFSVSEYEEGLFLLQYVPAHAYWALFITMAASTCCCSIFYTIMVGNGKGEGLWVCCIATLLLIFFVLWWFPQLGLAIYIWDFSVVFSAEGVADSIVSFDYLESVDVLQQIAIAVGVGGFFGVAETVIVQFC